MQRAACLPHVIAAISVPPDEHSPAHAVKPCCLEAIPTRPLRLVCCVFTVFLLLLLFLSCAASADAEKSLEYFEAAAGEQEQEEFAEKLTPITSKAQFQQVRP